jgi:signal transduction histidine kinase
MGKLFITPKLASWIAIFLWVIAWCLASWWSSNYWIAQNVKNRLQNSTQEYSKVIKEELGSIETRLLLDIAPLTQRRQFVKNDLYSELTHEFPEIVRIEIRDENGELLQQLPAASHVLQYRTLDPGLFVNFSASNESHKVIYSAPYNNNINSNIESTLIDIFIPTARPSKLMLVVSIDPNAWLSNRTQNNSPEIDKNQFYEILDSSLQVIATNAANNFANLGIGESLSAIELGNTSLFIRAKQVTTNDSSYNTIRLASTLFATSGSLLIGLLFQSFIKRRNTIVKLKKLQEKVQADSRAVTLGEMSTAIAHELNQPLGAIENFALGCERLLAKEKPCIEEVINALTQIRSEAQRGANVIKSIRAFVKRDNESQDLIDVATVLDGLDPLLRILAKSINCKLTIECKPHIHLFTNRALFEQVLLNLARNGFDSMNETPIADRVLKISATDFRNQSNFKHAVIKFSDNGSGIDKELEGKLFTPFFTTKSNGMGIGLNLCLSIVERQGGSIRWVRKDTVGTEFTLELPMASKAEA